MPRLKVDTAGSLYEPIEVEIDGHVCRVKPITRELLKQIDELDRADAAGRTDAAYKRLELMLEGLGPKKLDKLDIREIRRITEFIVDNAFKVSRDEKNELGPGSEKSPS